MYLDLKLVNEPSNTFTQISARKKRTPFGKPPRLMDWYTHQHDPSKEHKAKETK